MDVVFHTEKAVFNYRVAGVWIQDGRILLHRASEDKIWSLPGGRVEMNEASPLSLQREFKEELDLSVEIRRLVWIVENFFEYREKKVHEIGFYYLVSTEDKQALPNGPFHGVEGERLVYEWVPITELEDVVLYPEFLKKALKELPETTEHLIVNN
ncbi:NUDIX hydrolase [Sutcliffiella horikoshii]|uniref:NUDIX hydrolase n=1 Tax=Sutcliffiella horikoshii TaxID=79883 RepID=A0ABM6KKR0_9BACI|nr:NUDIX hydrolase [Sutcliffiella horikoshii]ART77026.1 NUDIX hydrolase [Sutcliffiella horikoshii]